MRKYKKISDCPPGLEKLLNFINLLPPDLDSFLKKLSELEEKDPKLGEVETVFIKYANQLDFRLRKILTSKYGDFWIFWRKELVECNLDKKALLFLITSVNSAETQKNKRAFAKLDNFLKLKASIDEKIEHFNVLDFGNDESEADWQEIIRRISDEDLKSLIENSPTKAEFELAMRANALLNESLANLKSHLFVNEKGFLDLSVSGLGEIVKKEKIKFDRIRICPICNFLFWAKKKNSETCGQKKCIDTLGNRKRLEKTKVKAESKQDLRDIWKNQDFSKN
ncbi:MAG TPA: hypothetical protein PKE69_12890 [Pyrinomonadaceae bacterium]|nr:hypothetical protein [Pyrinomonadaceae bacterium]